MDIFLRLNKEEKKTIIVVTHDPNICDKCQRIIKISDGLIIES